MKFIFGISLFLLLFSFVGCSSNDEYEAKYLKVRQEEKEKEKRKKQVKEACVHFPDYSICKKWREWEINEEQSRECFFEILESGESYYFDSLDYSVDAPDCFEEISWESAISDLDIKDVEEGMESLRQINKKSNIVNEEYIVGTVSMFLDFALHRSMRSGLDLVELISEKETSKNLAIYLDYIEQIKKDFKKKNLLILFMVMQMLSSLLRI